MSYASAPLSAAVPVQLLYGCFPNTFEPKLGGDTKPASFGPSSELGVYAQLRNENYPVGSY